MRDLPENSPALRRTLFAALLLSTAAALPACTVAVKAPEEPITINLNVKIDQEVRIRLDKEVEDLIADNPDLFGTGE
ncbi:MAG: YnbE family lipoprotein [Hyphomonadaceae bacterium]|nr:YnbE family lipoprotein [Hyphomonadaceae bacterium]